MRLIDADKLETHEQLESFGNGNYEYVEVVYKDDIDDAPTIESERKKGEWSNYKDEHCCSVCKCVVISDCWDDEIRYDYCPYCGAEME